MTSTNAKDMRGNTNNSAARVYMIHADTPSDTATVAMTTEPELYAAINGHSHYRYPAIRQDYYLANTQNVDSVTAKDLDAILHSILVDKEFRRAYYYKSLFLIGAGAYGSVFRVVSNATGSIESPMYNERYVRYLQNLRRTRSRKREGLLDSYRDTLCLDLVAMKVEALTPEDVDLRSANKIHLIKEFSMLTELFKNQSSANALVGFPLPIEFGFLGKVRANKDLKKVLVFDKYGRPSNYHDAYLSEIRISGHPTSAEVTNTSYMTMELVGPNLDEWKTYYSKRHSSSGKMVFSVQTTLKLMDQVLCRLLVMHKKNMVHLDLKPDNLCMGIGKMTNTVYLLDYGLSRICSDEKPNITMGSRRYMSVGVLNLQPANYMMDIESWFYVLIVLLTDQIPWSDEIMHKALDGSEQEQKVLLATKLKKKFWGDKGEDKSMLKRVIHAAESFHKSDVPDIGVILMDIYQHVKRMRNDFYSVSSCRMHSDILNDESDLFKRYHTLRKLLLFPYDCNFTGKFSCFAKDKDLARKQAKRREQYHMLVFAECGRNWQWDWDNWHAETLDEASRNNASNKSRPHERVRFESPPTDSHSKSGSMPDWMRHYLTRVMGSVEGAGVTEIANLSRASRTEPRSVQVP